MLKPLHDSGVELEQDKRPTIHRETHFGRLNFVRLFWETKLCAAVQVAAIKKMKEGKISLLVSMGELGSSSLTKSCQVASYLFLFSEIILSLSCYHFPECEIFFLGLRVLCNVYIILAAVTSRFERLLVHA